MIKIKVSILGLGYAGLVFATCSAIRGFKVYGVDIDEERVKSIAKGIPPFYEAGLSELLFRAVHSKALIATTDYRSAILNSDIIVIFVGTPTLPDGSCDLKQVRSACEMIGEVLKNASEYKLIVVRSTVPPGTTEEFVKPIIEHISGKVCGRDFGLCMCPEFIREGRAIEDAFKPWRVIIGEYDERSGNIFEKFYKIFLKEWKCPIIRTSTYNAELVKYASNAFLALKISFVNLIARVCENIPKADIKVIAEGIGLDPRIGKLYLNAGLGFGGSCLPKDLKALTKFINSLGIDTSLFRAILNINESQVDHIIDMVKKGLGTYDLKDVTVSVLGLSFKPGTDDIRESQSIKLVKKLLSLGARIKVHDPKALNKAKNTLKNTVEYCNDIYNCVKGAQAIIIATDWPEYRLLDLEKTRKLVQYPLIIDARRVLDPVKVKEYGFKYFGVGLTQHIYSKNTPYEK